MLSETETKKKETIQILLTNENVKSEIQKNHKKSLSELMNAIIEQQYTYVDIMNYIKAQYHAHWMKLVSSDWFSTFLPYLNLKDIANLDTAFCNHADRPIWLNLLKGHSIRYTVEIVDNRGLKMMTDWLITKNIHLDKLYFKYSGNFDWHQVLSDETISRLTQNNPSLKELKIENYSVVVIDTKVLLPCISMFCTQIEYLDVRRVNIPDNGIQSISRTCHKLKHLKFSIFLNYDGILELLKANRCLLSLILDNYRGKNAIILSDVLEVLGHHCPLLQNCHISDSRGQVTGTQMEIFTKGCSNLKELKLSLDISSSKMCHKLFHSLGSYNSVLEKVSLLRVVRDDNDELTNGSNTASTREHCQSLQYLSNGCPLLKEIDLKNFKLSTSDVSYFVNHSIHLETISFDKCCICDDGLIITKEADKLKYLKQLELCDNRNITDESIINLIKGCHNLETIRIDDCPNLTDTSLFSIAANCPNFKEIYLDFDKVNMTKVGLKTLLKSCPKFMNIASDLEVIPHKIETELKRRQALALNSK